MDVLRVFKAVLKMGPAQDYENSLVMDADVTKPRKKRPTSQRALWTGGGRTRPGPSGSGRWVRVLTCMLLGEKSRAREHWRKTKGMSRARRRAANGTRLFAHSANHCGSTEHPCCPNSQATRMHSVHSGASRHLPFSQEGGLILPCRIKADGGPRQMLEVPWEPPGVPMAGSDPVSAS